MVAGCIDVSGWDGVEDTDPAIDVAQLDVATTREVVSGVRAPGFAFVADPAHPHPDKPIPYRLSHEAGRALEAIDPLGMVP